VGVLKLVEMVNRHAVATPLKDHVLQRSFARNWPDFSQLLETLKKEEDVNRSPKRTTEDMLGELLNLVRGLDKSIHMMPALDFPDYLDEVLDPPWKTLLSRYPLQARVHPNVAIAAIVKKAIVNVFKQENPDIAADIAAAKAAYVNGTLILPTSGKYPPEVQERIKHFVSELDIKIKSIDTGKTT
jgi:hypothetical protein